MKIIRGRLNPADVASPDFRYSSSCDCVQYTPDGGTTWVDAPGSDPRHAPQYRLPPVAGSNKQCDAAANMVKWLRDFLTQAEGVMCAGAEVTTVINVALNFVDLLFPGAALFELILEAASVVFGVGCTALTGAFNDTVYDTIEGIFFCNEDGDGQVSAAKLADIESAITDQLTTTAALIVNEILLLQGEVGLSNAGAIGSETGDCTGFDCGWEACIAGTDLAVAFSIVGTNGTPTGTGIQTVTAFVGGDPTRPRTQAYITITLDSCSVNRLQCFFDAPDGFDNECGGGFATSAYFQNNFATAISVGTGTPTSPFVFAGGLTLTDLQVALGVACCDGCSTPPNMATITQVKIRGTGTTPSQLVPYLCT